MNRTVKYQGAFSRIVGFAGKRFLFFPPPPPSTFFFCFRSNFRAITRLETLATQATAAINDKQNAFDILIQNGADPSFKDNDGISVLHCAAEGGNTSIINKLLSLGLDINLKDVHGVTPLTILTE